MDESTVLTRAHGGIREITYVFLYLQLLDLVTTLIGFRMDATEAGPFVLWLMIFGRDTGVLLSKVLAIALAGLCIYLHKQHLVAWISYWYAALVVWNLGVILGSL